MKYVVITPVRNEAPHLRKTVESMIRQRVPPTEWIVVDDGSTDESPSIVAEAAKKHAWIRLVRRSDRGFRKSGAGVVEALQQGLTQLTCQDWEFIVKLDGDLEFEPDYFERALAAFQADPALGITGGDICHYQGDEIVLESLKDPHFHVRGATKIYRRACWEAIGGVPPVTGWDTLDEVKANMLKWKTYRLRDLRLIHLKPTGAADGNWKNAFKNGRGSYICGYHPMFLLGRCFKSLVRNFGPTESAGLFAGYFSSYFLRIPRIEDAALIRYLRTQQLRSIFGQPSLWDTR
jgi:poly-beta-1,6-N-acetyl-D-glucosamine synthase